MNAILKKIKDISGSWLLFLFPLFLFSCTDDSTASGNGSDGTAVISLTVHPSDVNQVTRTTSSSTESKISNMHVLVFNSSGTVVGSTYSSTADSTVSITTRQGTNYTIYAVANTGNSAFFQGIGTLTQFKKMLTTVDVNTSPLMCGSLSGQSVSQSSVAIGGLKLTRMFAKVTLNVTAATGITITGYQFCNVATSAYLNRDTVAGITWANKTAVTTSSISGVTCYMYGNPQGTVTHTDQIYKTQSAPGNASYVLITAKGYNSSYTSTYKIYLGSDNSSDYNVYRNYSYTYNITLNNLYGGTDTRVILSNISATTQATSNCYILNPGGNSIGILVSRANEDGTTRLSSTTSGWTCGLLWTDNSNVLSSSGAVASIVADLANGRIIVTSGTAKGNAIVYVKDSSGNIAWSWHIWVIDTPTSYTTSAGYIFMDRNLGAITTAPSLATTLGFTYEWGRKDPFPGQASYNTATSQPIYGGSISNILVPSSSNNLNYTIQHPNYLMYSNSSDHTNWNWYSTDGTCNYYLWNTSAGKKALYDPCPPGWRVPVKNAYSDFTASTFVWTTNGRSYGSLYFPYTDYFRIYNSGDASWTNYSEVFYRTGTCPYDGAYNQTSYTFMFTSSSIAWNGSCNLDGDFIRCVSE